MRFLIATLLLVAPASAWAGDYVYDGGAIPNSPKTDNVVTSIAPTKKIVAADWNAIVDALGSLRLGLLGGYYHGLSADSAAPPAPGSGLILFTMSDAGSGPGGGGLWLRNPDGTTARLAQESELPSVAYWNALDSNNIYTTKVTTVPDLDAGNVNVATLSTSDLATLDHAYVKGSAILDAGLVVRGDITASGNVAANSAKTDLVSSAGLSLGVTVNGDTPNGSASLFPGVIINNDQALGTAGDRLISIQNNSIEKANIDYGGGAYFNGSVKADGGIGFGDASTMTSSTYETICGFIGSTFSPQGAVFYKAHAAGQIKRCSWTGSFSGGATGNLTFTVVNADDGGVFCTKTQACSGKFDDGGSAAVTADYGYVDCNVAIPTTTNIIIGSSSSCSARPDVNYCCQIAYP